MKKAVGYLRRSTDRQEQSIEDQRQFISAKAKILEYIVVKWFTDDAISGASTENREEFQQMIEYVESSNGQINAVLCYDISRFGRTDTDEAGFYRYRLKQTGCKVVYVAENLPESRAGDLLRDVKQWQKREFLVDLSRDTVRGLISVARKGYSTGRRAPYGYDRMLVSTDGQRHRIMKDGDKVWKEKSDKVVLVPGDKKKIETVRWIFKTYAEEPLGIRSLVDRLNVRGIPSPNGGKWNTTTVSFMLRNPAYIGDMVYNRRAMSKFHRIKEGEARERKDFSRKVIFNPKSQWIVKHRAHKSIVSKRLFEKVQYKIKKRGNRSNKEIVRSIYNLSGLVYCGNCGAKMHGETGTRHKKNKTYRYRTYICSTYHSKGSSQCTSNRLDGNAIEEAVLEEIKKELLPVETKEELCAVIRKKLGSLSRRKKIDKSKIRREISELEKRANLILDNINPENQSMINSKLALLRREKESLESQLLESDNRKLEHSSLESAAQRAYELLLSLKIACSERARLLLKELLQHCVHRVVVTFKAEKQGKRTIHVPIKGKLEIYTFRGLVDKFTSRLSRGDPRSPIYTNFESIRSQGICLM